MARIALIVGVDQYKDEYFTDLKGAQRDASEINGFLKYSLPAGSRFETILLSNPTSEDVLRNLTRILTKLDDDSVFVFYFAGHGLTPGNAKNQSLLCSDATEFAADGITDAGTISPEVITSFVRKGRGDMFFCFDACRAPALARRGASSVEGTSSVRDAVAKIPRTRNDGRPANSWALSSCGDLQLASDNGEFAASMIDAMKAFLASGKGIILGDDFVRLIERNLQKRRPGTNQRPEAAGRPFALTPSSKPVVQKIDPSKTTIQTTASTTTKTSNTAESTSRPKKPLETNQKNGKLREYYDYEPIYNNKLERVGFIRTWDPKKTPGRWRVLNIKGAEYGFCYIPVGRFLMGSPEDEKERNKAERQHLVNIKRNFWILETPVTQKLWTDVMGRNPSSFCSTGEYAEYVEGVDTGNFPVESVSWKDCQTFIKRLNKARIAPDFMSFRLPTEKEWEYVCRATKNSPYWCGDSLDKDCANYSGKRTSDVKTHRVNPWELYDVHGNVDEWCKGIDYKYPPYSGRFVNVIKRCNDLIVKWHRADSDSLLYVLVLPSVLSSLFVTVPYLVTNLETIDGLIISIIGIPLLFALSYCPTQGLLWLFPSIALEMSMFIPSWLITTGSFMLLSFEPVESIFYGFLVALGILLVSTSRFFIPKFLSFIFRITFGAQRYRVIRGGNWKSNAGVCRSASRNHCKISNRLATVGFRLVLARKGNK